MPGNILLSTNFTGVKNILYYTKVHTYSIILYTYGFQLRFIFI